MTKHNKHKKLSTENFNHVVNVLTVETQKPLVSFSALAKIETTRINQKNNGE
jgi:hypothetical protein